jgi:NAD(P)-dependent dehydrogenase (short-subunit alcohol dehydrogenase family)
MGLIHRILDRSVLFSFDRSGFKRHQRGFDRSDLEVSLRGRVCLVTGANSGLGLAAAEGLAERGAIVHLLCRSEQRGAEAREEITRATGNPEVHLDIVDISRPGSVRDVVQRLEEKRVDVLIQNAGVLPLEREVTPEGFELTVATHIVGPFLLTRMLRSRLQDSRVIFVSSGGMYARRFDLRQMLATEGRYDGVASYAMTKRAQVILSELWAGELESSRTVVNAMHPGWAATPGVERSLPGFWRVMNGRLRTPAEGADTVLWLAAARKGGEETGKLWFDRRVVPTHLVPWTREASGARQSLWRWCEEATRSHVEGAD